MVKARHILRKTVFREIRTSLARYLAILFIIALGAGFFTGLRACKPSMLETGDRYIREQNLYDFRLLSTLGFTVEDAEAFAAADGVLSARGAVFRDFLSQWENGSSIVLRAHSLTDGVNRPRLVSGRLPERPDECLADAYVFGEESIGTVFPVSDGNSEETRAMFACDGYRVVGTCTSPYYLNFERGTTSLGTGKLTGFLYIPEEGFSFDVYSEIFVDADAPGAIYSEAYNSAAEALTPALTALVQERAALRYDDIVSEARQALAEATGEYEENLAAYQQERFDAETALDDALSTLYVAEDEIARREEQLDSTEYTLTLSRQQLQAGFAQISDSEAELEARETETYAQLEEQQEELELSLARLEASLERLAEQELTGSPQEEELLELKAQVLAGLEQLLLSREEAEAGFAQAREELQTRRAQLNASLSRVNAGLEEIETGRAALAEAREELAQGWHSYTQAAADAQLEFTKAENELDRARKELDDAQAEIDSLESPETYVLGRSSNIGYVCFENDSGIVQGISTVFPLFFFLVAALVCITTMTRMVDEQRTQIGILKALGYSRPAIMSKFLVYSGSAALLGCALGITAGTLVFPEAIWQAYSIMYGFAALTLTFDLPLAAVSTAAYLVCTLGVTYLACRQELTVVPAELIRPKAPKAGKRILLERWTGLWRRLKFLQKVSIRNIVRYKKRMFMMIFGIGGCTALLLTGFGISDSIKHLADYQFDEISLYDCAVTFSSPMGPTARESFLSKYDSLLSDCLFLHESSVDVSAGSGVKSANLVVSETDIAGFVDLHSGETPLSWPGLNEAVINRKLADELGVQAGDTITLRDEDMNAYTLQVSGIFDNYVFNYVYLSAETAVSQTGSAPAVRSAYLRLREGQDPHRAAAELADSARVSSVSLTADTRGRIMTMMSSMDYIVLLVTCCAGALALIVLYNLTNINITERLREIATIKVLGFFPAESAAYVFRENLVLTGLGALLGLGAGVALHRFVMSRIRIDLIYFQPRIAPLSYVYALALTFLFAVLVDLIMLRRLARINMAEALLG